MEGTVLLLTAWIRRPDGADADERHRHYLAALKAWSQSDAPPTVFCEGSGYPLDGVRALGRFFPRGFEVLQPAAAEPERALPLIEHALRHSRFLRDCRHVVQVKGRYFVHNLPRLLRALEPSTDVMADLYDDLRCADPRLFVARPQFLERFLLPVGRENDAGMSVRLEHALARAVLRAAGAGMRWQPIPALPRLVRASDRDTGPRRHRVGRAMLHRLKNHLHRRRLY